MKMSTAVNKRLQKNLYRYLYVDASKGTTMTRDQRT